MNIASFAAHVDRHADGFTYVRSSQSLGGYPAKITERLEHWAVHRGSQVFLAERGTGGNWEKLTYARTLSRVRSIAQGLLDRDLSSDRPIAILSGNSIDHALLALAAMYTGILYVPLRHPLGTLHPGLILTQQDMDTDDAEIVRSCAALEASSVSTAVDDAHALVGPDTIAKILFTSGSTGYPKGVINTQRMLCSNQEMIRSVLRFLAEEPPVLCDWLPWNHTFGGNHNFGIVLYNGGTLYIDSGRPTATGFATTFTNLSEIATTAYFNVPKGYAMLVPALHADAKLRNTFFSRVQLLFCAAAGMKQQVWDDLRHMARDTCGKEIPMITGFGATESAPAALFTGKEGASAGRIGLPVPGVELKLVPVREQFELHLKGPNITPGFWRNDDLTRTSFDKEGFYRTGDAVTFADPLDPQQGFLFAGRLADDFKLSTGTWVHVEPLRAKFLSHFGDAVRDVVIAAPDRDFVTALVFPSLCSESAQLQVLLNEFACQSTGTATRIVRILVVDELPSLDAGEITAKGTISGKAVLANRPALVEELYAAICSDRVIEVS